MLPVVALLISQGLRFKALVDVTAGKKGIKARLQEAYDIPDPSICEVLVPAGFPQAKGSGIEDLFSKRDFATLLGRTGNPPGTEYAGMPNSAYMGKHATVPKRVMAHEFLRWAGDYQPDDFEAETIENARRVLDFCANDAWFLM